MKDGLNLEKINQKYLRRDVLVQIFDEDSEGESFPQSDGSERVDQMVVTGKAAVRWGTGGV